MWDGFIGTRDQQTEKDDGVESTKALKWNKPKYQRNEKAKLGVNYGGLDAKEWTIQMFEGGETSCKGGMARDLCSKYR